MKNKQLKGYISALCVGLLLALQLNASNISISPSAASTNNLVTSRAGGIQQLVLANSTTSPITVKLFDAPSTNLTLSIGAYTNVTRSVIQNTNIYTDILGNSVTNIYTVSTNIVATVNSSTPQYRTVGTWVVSSNSTVTVPYSTPNLFSFGLLSTNSGAINISVDYQGF